HGTELRRDPAGDRFAAADRPPRGGDARRLEGRPGRRHRAVAEGSRGAAGEVSQRVDGGQALPAPDAATEPLTAGEGGLVETGAMLYGLLGGALIGLAATVYLLATGRV